MADDKQLRHRVLLGILASPTTVIPFLAGMTALVGAWATGVRADIGVLAGLAGVLGSAGMFYTKLLLNGEDYARKAIEEMQVEAHKDRERALDDLETRLVADGDKRTEAALRDLRSLTRAFEDTRESVSRDLTTQSTYDVVAGVKRLFDQCICSLEKTLKLWHTSQELETKAAREPIRKQREEILKDVARSIRQLGHTLVAVQNLASGEGGQSELARIGSELDEHLAVAKRVEERVRAFEKQLDTGLPE